MSFEARLDVILETTVVGQLARHFAMNGELSADEMKELLKQGWLTADDIERLVKYNDHNPDHPVFGLLPARRPKPWHLGHFGSIDRWKEVLIKSMNTFKEYIPNVDRLIAAMEETDDPHELDKYQKIISKVIDDWSATRAAKK